jgi:hypothetical protein
VDSWSSPKPTIPAGLVNCQVVKEQLVYEVHDPSQYITPDVTLDFTGVRVREIGRTASKCSAYAENLRRSA